jgi:hypothetical protein
MSHRDPGADAISDYQSFHEVVVRLPRFIDQVYNRRRLHSSPGCMRTLSWRGTRLRDLRYIGVAILSSLRDNCQPELANRYRRARGRALKRTEAREASVPPLLLEFQFTATPGACSSANRRRRTVAQLGLTDLTASEVSAFLNYTEQEGGDTIGTRNCRLSALRTFLGFVAGRDRTGCRNPAHSDEEGADPCGVLFGAGGGEGHSREPDRSTVEGQRDHAILAFLYNIGARIKEVLDVRLLALRLDSPACVRLYGKGAKKGCDRCGGNGVAAAIATSTPAQADDEPIFVNRYGGPAATTWRIPLRWAQTPVAEQQIAWPNGEACAGFPTSGQLRSLHRSAMTAGRRSSHRRFQWIPWVTASLELRSPDPVADLAAVVLQACAMNSSGSSWARDWSPRLCQRPPHQLIVDSGRDDYF